MTTAAKQPASAPLPRVVVVGGGFAGLWAVRAMRQLPVEILLIDRHNHHLFQPLLYQVATAGLAAPSIAAPLRHILRGQRNVTVLLGEVSSVDTAAQRIHVDGRNVAYDFLVLATGAEHSYFGHDDWGAHAPGLKTLSDALLIRERILCAFESAESEPDAALRTDWLTFAVIGGGPTGVELAGTLAEIARHTLRREFRRIDPRTARVVLIEAGPRVLPAFAPALSAHAQAQLERLGVTVQTGAAVSAVGDGWLDVGGQRLRARTVLWAAGIKASPLGTLLGAPLDRAGRVLVDADLSVPGRHNVFVAGDLASVSGASGPVPGIATAAKQMGHHVALAIGARLAGRTTRPFRYRDFGSLATIGRRAAVVEMAGLKLWGAPAWLLWLGAHIFFLIGFRNRAVVMIDWAWAYFSYQRSARIVFGRDDRPIR